jgi:preprotein translocase subunit SecB
MNKKISREEYLKILQSLKLKDVSLRESRWKVSDTFSRQATQIALKLSDKYTYQKTDEFVFYDCYFVLNGTTKINEIEEKILSVSGKFRVSYFLLDKKITLDNDFFDVYKKSNLPLFIWPYIREFIQSMSIRASLPPLILPIKICE